MTSRPALPSKQRPLSAIFLGSGTTPSSVPDLPDLPDPPILSPSSSSGLPSPPATDSNSSGSNGGNSTSGGSLRGSASKSTPRMRHDDEPFSNGKRRADPLSSDEEETNDEDHTAKFSNDAKRSVPDDVQTDQQRIESLKLNHQTMLARVSSLTTRSRLSTPSPSTLARRSRSPVLSLSSKSASSSKSSQSEKRSDSPSRRSGSETEREREHVDTDISPVDDVHSATSSKSSFSTRSKSMRVRRASEATSPERSSDRPATSERSERPLGIGDSSTVGRRGIRPESRADRDLEEAALAAVAKTRRESSARRRQPLPLEFRDTLSSADRPRSSLDGRPPLETPSTPHRFGNRRSPTGFVHFRSPSSSQAATIRDSPGSPRLNGGRFSSRRNQTRWSSQDLPARSVDFVEGRSQSRRPGSGDSLLATSNRGIEKSFRAAGLTWKRDEATDDAVRGEQSRPRRLSGGLTVDVGSSRPGTRLSNRTSMTAAPILDRTPDRFDDFDSHRTSNSVLSRPRTSLAAYRDPPQTEPPRLRAPKSTLMLDSEPSRPLSRSTALVQSRNEERASSSLAVVRRENGTVENRGETSGSGSAQDHNRLILDSLRMFESYLTRLPPMGGMDVPELFRSAQSVVEATNKLNTLLRTCNTNANAEAIHYEIEKDEPADPVAIWQTVAGDFRETVRASDELVRTTTSFLLGVGKILRDSTAERSHVRTTSLDETISRRHTPDYGPVSGRTGTSEGRASSDGRSSIDKRRWESSAGDSSLNTRSYASIRSSQPSSSSSRSQTSNRLRIEANVSSPIDEGQELASKSSKATLNGLEPTRRLSSLALRSGDTPEAFDSNGDTSFQSMESPLAHIGGGVRRSKTLAVPPSLSTIPSTDLTRRSTTNSKFSVRLGKQLSASTSTATVRGHSISLTSSNPTTAVNTTAVQASPERPRQPGSRVADAARTTISRTTGAFLAGLQQRVGEERHRTLSATSALEGDVFQARSGMELDRETRPSFEGRPRISLDSAVSTRGERRDRRGTVSSFFNRS